MSQKSQGNKPSKAAESRPQPGKAVKSDACGGKQGMRFPVPDHNGMGSVDKGPKAP